MKRALSALLAPLAAAAALAFPSPAHATPEQDRQLINLLWENGWTIGPYSSVNAQVHCNDLRAGYSFDAVMLNLYLQEDGATTMALARELLTIYATAYCPEQIRVGKLLA